MTTTRPDASLHAMTRPKNSFRPTEEVVEEMKRIMSEKVGIVRRPKELASAAAALQAILEDELEPAFAAAAAADSSDSSDSLDSAQAPLKLSPELVGARNAAAVSLAIARAAAANPVSVGTHYVVGDDD